MPLIHFERYSSLSQLIKTCCDNEPSENFINKWREYSPSTEIASRDKSQPEWYGTHSWEDALALVSNGWEDGRKIVKNYTNTYSSIWRKFFPQQQFTQQFNPNVSGGMLMVDKFIEGNPECMLEFAPNETLNADNFGGCKLQRIIVHCGVSCSIAIETIYQRGALIAALVNSMEESGFNIELNLAWQVKRGDKILSHSLIVKNFTEQLDIDKLAFCVAHSSMFRRFIFALKELAPEEFSIPFCIGGSYGSPINLDSQQIKNYGIDINHGEVLKHGNMYFKMIDDNYNLDQLVAQCTTVVKEHFTEVSFNKES